MVFTAFFEVGLYALPGLLLLVSLCLLLCMERYLGSFLLGKKPGTFHERGVVSILVSILISAGIVGLGVFNTSLQELLNAPLKDLSKFFVLDFNTQTAAGSWNSFYVFAILIAALLMAALVWSFGESQESDGHDKPYKGEGSPDADLPQAEHDTLNIPEEGENP